MKRKALIINIAAILASVFILIPAASSQEDGATPEEVYELIINAVPVIEQLGEEGLQAFNDPKGEFVHKDAYVYVIDCATMTMAAHPSEKVRGMDLTKHPLDRNPDPVKAKRPAEETCELSKRPYGAWLEYYWNKLGSKEVARKIAFVINVPGTSYALTASIFDDSSDIAKLNASLK